MSSVVPDGWSKNTINECCEILDSQRVPVNSEERAKRKGDYPYYGANGVQGYIDDYIFEGDAILLAEDGGNFDQYADRPIAQWVTGKFWVNNHAHILRAKDNATDKWIFYSLVHKNILKNINGGTRAKLNQSDLKEIEILLSPLPEQKKIASILTSVDEVIENTQKQIDKLQDLKKATMNELLTKGIGHTEFKDSELGRIPRSWEVRAISEVVSIPNGQVDPKLEPYASMPHIGSGNIISWTGQIRGVQTAFEAGQISGKYLFSKNHILYSKVRPNLAKVCMPKFDGICSADVYPLIPKQKVSGKFVFQYLLTEKFTQIATEVSERTGMPKINRQDLNVLKLPMPPFEEQSEIARKIEAIDKATSLKSIKLAQTQSLKKSLMQDLLTGRVRVNL